jgi:hypothetical protein
MFDDKEIESIKEEFGCFSSWAIWNFQDEKDTSIIEQNIKLLHSNFVLIGLNISKPIGIWENFRVGKHDRKIMYAFNSIPEIKGAYMTDLIKLVEVDSNKINAEIQEGKIDINEQVKNFEKELKKLKITSKSKFIIFGDLAGELYDNYYEKYFPDNKVYYFKHYSGRGTDKEWVEYVWNRLNVKYLNFEDELKKYKRNINA